MQTAEPKENLLYQSERKTHTLSFEVSLASQCLDGCSLFFLRPPPEQVMHILIIIGDSNWSCSCLQMKPAWLSPTEKRGDYAESGESADCRDRKDNKQSACLNLFYCKYAQISSYSWRPAIHKHVCRA